jgi:hypothetical protein
MEWFETHVWVAAWLAVPLPIIGILVSYLRPSASRVRDKRAFIYLAFLTCLAVTVTPTFNEVARNRAGTFAAMCIGAILVGAVRD